MDILCFQGVRPFRLGGGTIMDILYFQGVWPFRFGGGELSWTSFTSKAYDPLGWGGSSMDILYWHRESIISTPQILYFQGLRPFRLRRTLKRHHIRKIANIKRNPPTIMRVYCNIILGTEPLELWKWKQKKIYGILHAQQRTATCHKNNFIEGSLEAKLPTICRDGKAEVGRVSEEKSRREKIRDGESQWKSEERRCRCAKR